MSERERRLVLRELSWLCGYILHGRGFVEEYM